MAQKSNISTAIQIKNILVKLKEKTLSEVLKKLSKIESDYIEEQDHKDIFEYILIEVAKEFNISNVENIIYNRSHGYSLPRNLSMLLIKKHTNLSVSEITSLFDNRNRQSLYTVIEYYNKLDRNNKYDREIFLDVYDRLNENIKNYINNNSLKNK